MSSKERPPGYDPQKDKIEIIEPNPGWPNAYLKEAAALRETLVEFSGLWVEHVGSTAVPGLAAKPIIDMLLAVDSREIWPRLVQPLAKLHYVHGENAFDEFHWFFVKGMPPYGEKRTHQIHLMEYPGPKWKMHIDFRDYLRSHPEDVRRYETLKRELAAKFSTDREAYTEAKAEFIQDVLKKIPEG